MRCTRTTAGNCTEPAIGTSKRRARAMFLTKHDTDRELTFYLLELWNGFPPSPPEREPICNNMSPPSSQATATSRRAKTHTHIIESSHTSHMHTLEPCKRDGAAMIDGRSIATWEGRKKERKKSFTAASYLAQEAALSNTYPMARAPKKGTG